MVSSDNSLWQRITKSFHDSVGDIVFGMEDGTVSIFGLVAGVAGHTTHGSVVLLAGATGAIAAAISMMAGTFLEVESTNDQIRAKVAHERQEIETHLEEEKQEVRELLQDAGFSDQEVAAIVEALARHPNTLLQVETAFELQLGIADLKNPFVQSAWMFIANLLAASIPVMPFAVFSLETARLISCICTAVLLLLLGIGRGLIRHHNILQTTLETLSIAAAAALAGFLIGHLITLL